MLYSVVVLDLHLGCRLLQWLAINIETFNNYFSTNENSVVLPDWLYATTTATEAIRQTTPTPSMTHQYLEERNSKRLSSSSNYILKYLPPTVTKLRIPYKNLAQAIVPE